MTVESRRLKLYMTVRTGQGSEYALHVDAFHMQSEHFTHLQKRKERG